MELDYQGAIVHYENLMAENVAKYVGKPLDMNDIIRRDSFTEACLCAIDHLHGVIRARATT